MGVAVRREGGHEFYGRTMTADGVMVLTNGSVMTRDDVVAALGQSPPWASYEMDDVRVVSVRRGLGCAGLRRHRPP